MPRADLLKLFLARVTKGDGCWEHSGSLGSHGYPQATSPRGGSTTAHRAGWLLQVGEIPPRMMVLHNCNNKLCVRLDHLRLGTHKDNMDDMARVGHPSRKLSPEQVHTALASAAPLRHIAAQFGVDMVVIQNLRRGKTYRHVARAGTNTKQRAA